MFDCPHRLPRQAAAGPGLFPRPGGGEATREPSASAPRAARRGGPTPAGSRLPARRRARQTLRPRRGGSPQRGIPAKKEAGQGFGPARQKRGGQRNTKKHCVSGPGTPAWMRAPPCAHPPQPQPGVPTSPRTAAALSLRGGWGNKTGTVPALAGQPRLSPTFPLFGVPHDSTEARSCQEGADRKSARRSPPPSSPPLAFRPPLPLPSGAPFPPLPPSPPCPLPFAPARSPFAASLFPRSLCPLALSPLLAVRCRLPLSGFAFPWPSLGQTGLSRGHSRRKPGPPGLFSLAQPGSCRERSRGIPAFHRAAGLAPGNPDRSRRWILPGPGVWRRRGGLRAE
jgi:hypothetical protein